jgi:hypothetical protein
MADRPIAAHLTQGSLVVVDARAREPDCAGTVLDDRHSPARRIRVGSQLSIAIALQAQASSDPQTAITSRPQAQNAVRNELLARRRGKGYEAHAVKAHQAAARPDPQIAVDGLNHLRGSAREEAVLH